MVSGAWCTLACAAARCRAYIRMGTVLEYWIQYLDAQRARDHMGTVLVRVSRAQKRIYTILESFLGFRGIARA